jgi:NAD kinase
VVVSSKTTVRVIASRVNDGTTLFCDGQAMSKLCNGDIVVVRRGKYDALLVEDPDAREWRSLAEKLNWAAGPKYNEHD